MVAIYQSPILPTSRDLSNLCGLARWPMAITNILSLRLVKREYPVRYDGEDFIVHRASSWDECKVWKHLIRSLSWHISMQTT
jgi:hypothetical protein